MPQPNTPIERLLARERAIVIAALAVVITASWLYLLAGAGTGMSTLEMTSWRMALGIADAMAMPSAWSLQYAWLMLLMWWVMMIAMMLPSAAPAILLHARMSARSLQGAGLGAGALLTFLFAAGYMLAWGLFSIVATGLQWAFEAIGVLSPMMMNSTSRLFAGLILLIAGLYQATPLKQACLTHCRSPLSFLLNQWQEGRLGALRMGVQHGLYCLGCCWALMAILFFGGLMNLYWIIGLALLVLVEKVLPGGPLFGQVSGALFAIAGGGLILRVLVG